MRSMAKRIFWSIFAVVLVVLLACTTLVGSVLYGSYKTQLSDELSQEAQLAAVGVESSGSGYLASLAGISTRITLIAPDGSVAFDNEADPETMGNHGEREEVVEAREMGSGDSTRYSSTLGTETLYHAVLLSDGTVLRASISLDSISAMLARLVQPLVIILAAVIALSAFLAYLLARHVVSPLNGLDLEHPETCDTYRELDPLLLKVHAQNLTIASQMESLRRKQRELSQITAHMREGLVVTDARGDVLSINRMAVGLFDVQDARPVGQSVLELDRGDAFRTVMAAALQGRSAQDSLTRSGRHYQLIASPVFADTDTDTDRADGEGGAGMPVDGAVLIILDVTERYDWEKLRSEFATNVSHELKTPLTALSGTAEILGRGMVAPEDVPHFAGRIYEESQRLIALVTDIIEISRLDEREVVYEKESVDLHDLAAAAMAPLESTAADKGVSLDLAGVHVEVAGVRRILEEMVANLVDNAVKYTSAGGHVRVSVEGETPHARAQVIVEDDGIGIPADDLDRVFERFYRVDKSRSQDAPGTGLGLSIVKHGAAYHGIDVTLESEEGIGTKAAIVWP